MNLLHTNTLPRRAARVRSALSNLIVACIAIGAVGLPSNSRTALAEGESPVENCTAYFQNASGDGTWATPANWDTGQLLHAENVACVIEEVSTIDAVVAVRQLHGSGTRRPQQRKAGHRTDVPIDRPMRSAACRRDRAPGGALTCSGGQRRRSDEDAPAGTRPRHRRIRRTRHARATSADSRNDQRRPSTPGSRTALRPGAGGRSV